MGEFTKQAIYLPGRDRQNSTRPQREFGTFSVGGRRLFAGSAFGAMFEDVGIPDTEKRVEPAGDGLVEAIWAGPETDEAQRGAQQTGVEKKEVGLETTLRGFRILPKGMDQGSGYKQ